MGSSFVKDVEVNVKDVEVNVKDLTSQIESTRLTQYTLLYENEKFECELSLWRLLLGAQARKTVRRRAL